MFPIYGKERKLTVICGKFEGKIELFKTKLYLIHTANFSFRARINYTCLP